MKTRDSLSPLRVPALRARMGDWVYYVAVLKMRDVAVRVKFASELFTSNVLSELMQRKLSSRSKDISKYLLSQPQRFFNAIVVGTYGGNPQWYEIDIRTFEVDDEILPDYSEGIFGILELSAEAEIWAIDGQHRVAGIRAAVRENPDFGDEELSVIFTSGVNSSNRSHDPEGFERTRRLFTTLNRHAKAVSKSDIVALDENDLVAVITRNLIEDYPLLQDRVALGSRNLLPSDHSSLTTIEVLYDVVDIILRDKPQSQWKNFKIHLRPSDEIIKKYQIRAVQFWDTMTKHYDVLDELKNGTEQDMVVSRYRNLTGGNVLFRPVGLLIITRSIRMLIDSGLSIEQAVEAMSRVPQELDRYPWINLIWDAVNTRMITIPEHQHVAAKLAFYGAGGDLSRLKPKQNLEKLQKEYAGIIRENPLEIIITRYVE